MVIRLPSTFCNFMTAMYQSMSLLDDDATTAMFRHSLDAASRYIRTASRIKINPANSCNHSVLYTVNRCLQMVIGSHSRNGFRHAEGYSYCSGRSSRTSRSYLARDVIYTRVYIYIFIYTRVCGYIYIYIYMQRTASFGPVCCDILNSNAFLQRSCCAVLREA
jgi:hypothetical protein